MLKIFLLEQSVVRKAVAAMVVVGAFQAHVIKLERRQEHVVAQVVMQQEAASTRLILTQDLAQEIQILIAVASGANVLRVPA